MTDLIPIVREMLRRAVLTLAALPDRARPQEFGNPLASRVVHAVEEAYGYASAGIMRFKPTPHDVSIYLEVMSWLSWYEREVNADRALAFVAWAEGVPIWRIGARHKRGEDTVKRWLADVTEEILNHFGEDIQRLALDSAGTCAAEMRIPNTITDSVSNAPPPRSQTFARTLDAVPTRDAAHVEGSEAQRDRARTVKRIERNARNNERSKRKAQQKATA